MKNLKKAKHRLSSLLKDHERYLLCLTMFEDVVNALVRSENLDCIIVITSDSEVLVKAKDFGIKVLYDSGKGLNESLTIATNYCIKLGAKNVTIVPIDIPLIKPEDVDEAISMAENIKRVVVISPSKDGYGTNLLYRQPPDVIPTRYGVGSFEWHREAALANNIRFRVYKNPRIALDIDKPEDLVEFIKIGKHTKTFNMLHKLHLVEKIRQKFLTI